jgi:hypothetical protein
VCGEYGGGSGNRGKGKGRKKRKEKRGREEEKESKIKFKMMDRKESGAREGKQIDTCKKEIGNNKLKKKNTKMERIIFLK